MRITELFTAQSIALDEALQTPDERRNGIVNYVMGLRRSKRAIFTKNGAIYRQKRPILPELRTVPGFGLHPIPACGILISVSKSPVWCAGAPRRKKETNDENRI